MNEISIELAIIIGIFLFMIVLLYVRISKLAQRVDLLGTVVYGLLHSIEHLSESERALLDIMNDVLNEEDRRSKEMRRNLDEVDEIVKKYFIV